MIFVCVRNVGVTRQIILVKFQVLTAASMKFRVIWDILPCSETDVKIVLAW
jgi:hypothetical protein